MQDLVVVIVNWNTRDLLSNCLRSIFQVTHSLSMLVSVVDNHSTDGSDELLQRDYPQVLLIQNQSNEGFARACNKGIRSTESRHILLLNSDTKVGPLTFEKMVGFLDSHPEAGAVGCKLIDRSGNTQLSAGSFPSMATAILGGVFLPQVFRRMFHLSWFPGQTLLSQDDHDDIHEVDWITGACMMVRREAIVQVGLLDESLFMYGEEVDWCYRLKKGGWGVFYIPDPHIIHYHGASAKNTKQVEAATLRRVFADKYIYRKYHNIVAYYAYVICALVMACAKSLIWKSLMWTKCDGGRAPSRISYHVAILRTFLNMNTQIHAGSPK